MSSEKPSIEAKRHSLSHILAQAVLSLFPEAKLAIGPAIEHGFYYDFDLPRTLIPEDLEILQKKMEAIVKENQVFSSEVEPIDKAIEYLKKIKQPYKVELAEDFKKEGSKEVSFHRNGPFVDLCRGGHVNSTGQIQIGSFKLDKIAGAYWRGSEKNPMLQRIYGLAFESKKELQEHLKMREEAEKRDHRKLGKELDLYVLSPKVGPGLPLLTPKGTVIRHELAEFSRQKHVAAGYSYVTTPNLGDLGLYRTSGHYPYYAETMFPPLKDEESEYMLRPMNCPHHIQIYDSRPRSYRELPLRLREDGLCFRYEKSGELGGLTRVRALTIDDAHIFCTPEQMEAEINACIDLSEEMYRVFGLTDAVYTLSLRDPKDKKKYVGGDENWNRAESILREALRKRNVKFTEHEGEAAFYGPKIDVKVKDVLGREWQLATIPQVDYNMPERFDLHYIDEKGEKQRPIILHRAIYGSYERFMGLIIEHFAGAFPTWLAPVQVAILPVAAAHEAYAQEVRDKLLDANVRVELMLAEETLGKRIRLSETQKIPYALVLGDKEIEAGSVAVRNYHTKKQEVMKAEAFMKIILEEIKERKLPSV